MAFLLDTNIVSTHLNRRGGLTHRFLQYSGRLYISTVVVGELYAWAYLRPDPLGFIARIENELLPDLIVLDFDRHCGDLWQGSGSIDKAGTRYKSSRPVDRVRRINA